MTPKAPTAAKGQELGGGGALGGDVLTALQFSENMLLVADNIQRRAKAKGWS